MFPLAPSGAEQLRWLDLGEVFQVSTFCEETQAFLGEFVYSQMRACQQRCLRSPTEELIRELVGFTPRIIINQEIHNQSAYTVDFAV